MAGLLLLFTPHEMFCLLVCSDSLGKQKQQWVAGRQVYYLHCLCGSELSGSDRTMQWQAVDDSWDIWWFPKMGGTPK